MTHKTVSIKGRKCDAGYATCAISVPRVTRTKMIVKRIFFLIWTILYCRGSIVFANQNTVQGIAQYVRIWTANTFCEGDYDADAATSGNFTLSVSYSKYVSLKLNGLWSYRFCTTNGATCLQPTVLNDFDGKYCRTIWVGSSSPVMNLHRHGDPHQIEHSLHLFSQSNLMGNEVVVRENSNIPAMTVGSYFFSGLGSWTMYGSPNFEGETHCRKPIDGVVTAGYGFTYLPLASFTVASVSTGCVDLQPPTTTTALPIDGNCTRPGSYYVPYSGDCSKFLICHNGQLLPEVKQCPEGTLFDDDLGDCNLEAEVDCKPVCPAEGTVTFPHYRNCSLYWLCIFGDRILRQCAPELVYDSSAGVCNLVELVFCPNMCPPEGSINLPHSGDCQLYWSCLAGAATLSRCETGFLFNSEKGQCYPDDLVECDERNLLA